MSDCGQEFLAKRVERRQAETLIEETEAREAIEADRRNQQSIDDWYLNRMRSSLRSQSAPTWTPASNPGSPRQNLSENLPEFTPRS